MKRLLWVLVSIIMGSPFQSLADADSKPSKKPAEKCAWEKFSDADLGLSAWVQRCNYGNSKVDFVRAGNALALRNSDDPQTEPIITVIDLLPGESVEQGIARVARAHADSSPVDRCVVGTYHEGKTPAGMKRYSFVPNPAYRKALHAKQTDGIPDPPCGDWGETADGIQYFESIPASGVNRFLFVNVGQDDPLFDEASLKLLPAH